MTLNTVKCNCLTPLHFKGLTLCTSAIDCLERLKNMFNTTYYMPNTTSNCSFTNPVDFWTAVKTLLSCFQRIPVAVWGCLPPEAKVCVAAPANQISFAIRVFFRISGLWTNFWVSSSSLPSYSLPFSLLSPLISHPPILHPFPSPPFKIGPWNRARTSGERCKLLQRGLRHSPSRNWIWCILALKSDIWL